MDHPSDPVFLLDDGLSVFAPTGGGQQSGKGRVGGLTRVFDTGSSTTPWAGMAQFETSVLDLTNGDETYYLTIRGGQGFATDGSGNKVLTGTTVELATWHTRVTGQSDLVPVNTLSVQTNQIYRYLQLVPVVNGTTPSIATYAFVRPLSAVPQYTLTEQIQTFVTLCQNDRNAKAQMQAWMTGVAWGGIGNDGKYPMSDGFGNTYYLKCPAQWGAEANDQSPVYYGAIMDGNSHPASDFYATLAELQAVYPFATSLHQEMDYLAWQKAVNIGGYIRSPNGPKDRYKMMNASGDPQTPLKLVAGNQWVDGHGCKLDYTDMRPDTTDTWVSADPYIASSSGWANASVYGSVNHVGIDFVTFGGGHAIGTDVRTDGSGPFYQFGRQVTLDPGNYEIICTVTFTRGGSYDHGNGNPPFFGMQFFSASPGVGGNLSGSSASGGVDVVADDVPKTVTLRYVFNVGTTQTGWMTFSAGGYINIDMTLFGVRVHKLNCAIWLTRDTAEGVLGLGHYPLPMPLSGLKLQGPGRIDYPESRAFKWHSYFEIDGNLINAERLYCTNFGIGADMGNGAYLIEFNQCIILGCEIGVNMPAGTINAGENLRFVGGQIAACAIGIYSPGGNAEFTLYGTTLDYFNTATAGAGTAFKGGGRVELHGVHVETRGVLEPGIRTFDITNGTVTMFGGMLLFAPPVGSSIEPPFALRTATSTFRFVHTDIYNWSSVDGVMGDGPGQILGTIRNNGNPNIGSILMENAVMDVLGGAGQFPDNGGWGDVSSRIYIEGGAYSYAGTTTDQWNGSDHSVVRSDDYVHPGGSKCLKVSKVYGTGTGCSLRIMIPVRQNENVLGRIRFLFPQNLHPTLIDGVTPDPTATATLYYRLFWVRQIGFDSHGRPKIAQSDLFKGEVDLHVPLNGSLSWVTRGIGTLYSQDTTNPDLNYACGAPAWANRLMIVIDNQSLPPMSFYIADLKANVIG